MKFEIIIYEKEYKNNSNDNYDDSNTSINDKGNINDSDDNAKIILSYGTNDNDDGFDRCKNNNWDE